jgi:hypothetical protein
MNPKINSSSFQNYPIINKISNDKNIILDTSSLGNKDFVQNQEHNINSLFKVVQEEKEPPSPNTLFYMNGDKSNKSQSKNINIIKPKFVTRQCRMENENLKLKNAEESPSLNLNLSLNLSGSAFQPQIIKKDKEFKVKINNKIFNLVLDLKNDVLKIKLYEINENIYLLKFFYENNYALDDLKLLHKFFYLFDNISDTLIELEKLLSKNKYNVIEDLENKKAKIQIKVVILEREENIELSLSQKSYSKDNLFEILCKKVSSLSNDYNQRMLLLERDNQFLLMNYFHLINTMNPMNMNYQINPRENNINKINRNFNNNMNMNKKISLVKNISNYENKYNDNNKENINNYEYDDMNEASNDISNTDNFYDDKEINGSKKLNRKRRRRRKSSNSNSSNKNDTVPVNVIKPIEITNNLTNTNSNIDSANNDNYYFLRDIKSKKILKCKGLYEIVQTPDELYLIINKILYKLNKYKKNYNIPNYENKLQFSIIILFDSSFNGDSAYEFHKRCDLKYNTISIIETKSGHRFGGYTSECFESPNEYFDKKDNLSFVFSLDKMKIYDVIKGKYAISCDKNYGPYFRDDHICIVDEFLTKESGTCIKGKGFNTTKNYELNSGKKYFTIKRLQVFQIKIRNLK